MAGAPEQRRPRGAAGNVGGYNNFWVGNGTEYYTIDGQKRMSVIVDPPDGRVPALTPQARQRAASRVARPVLYNNLHQIVQTRDTVLILNEMVHDARVVRIGGEHLPAVEDPATGGH